MIGRMYEPNCMGRRIRHRQTRGKEAHILLVVGIGNIYKSRLEESAARISNVQNKNGSMYLFQKNLSSAYTMRERK